MKRLQYLFLVLFACVVCSCEHDNDDPEPEKTPAHTLLIYMIGDNNLSSFCYQNVRSIEKGLLSTNEDINVVIYKDNKDSRPDETASLPELFQLKKSFDKKTHTTKIDTVYIERFNVDRNSCSIESIKEIVELTFSTFNSDVKGLEFWGHGLSWIPQKEYKTKATRYIGFDEQGANGITAENYIQIWDVRKALESVSGLHLDYMMFDACNMATAEVAYEFAGVSDYLLGATTEILDAGFPYDTFIATLATCSSKSTLRNALCGICDEMQKHYPDYGTFSVIDNKNIEQLANNYASMLKANAQRLEEIKLKASTIDKKLQHFGGPSTGSWYYIYDMEEFAKYLGTDISAEISASVARYYYADSYVSLNSPLIPISNYCGIGVSIPELFGLASTKDLANTTYGLTKWGKKMGY